MTNPNFRRTVVGAAVSAALALAGPADAGPYRGTFDPIDFSGEYTIAVSAACLAQADGWYANSGPTCGAMLIGTFADVTSDASDEPPLDPYYSGRLTFAPPNVSDPAQLFGLYIVGHQIDSFDTVLLPHQAALNPTEDQDNQWWIQFVSGHCPQGQDCYGGNIINLFSTDVAPSTIGDFSTLGNGVFLFVGSEPDPNSPVDKAEYTSRAVDLAIPEPGTLSLLLGALGGGWLARRRRKEKVPDPN